MQPTSESSLHPEAAPCDPQAAEQGSAGAGGRTFWTVAVSAAVLGLCLFGDTFIICSTRAVHVWDTFPGSFLRAATPFFTRSDTQWLLASCLGAYLLLLLLWQAGSLGRIFWRMGNPDLWLLLSLAIGMTDYALHYSVASRSTSFLVFLTGVVLALGVRMWRERRGSGGSLILIMAVLMVLLSAGSFWDAQISSNFKYRGHPRSSGPWESPNYYGMFMGVGMVLAAGMAISRIRGLSGDRARTGRTESGIGNQGWLALCALCLSVLGYGLLRSYSRGAWLATLCGAAYLSFPILRHWISLTPGRTLGKILPSMVILLSAGVLVFWTFRETEWRPARRVFSVANANDFSWRNRVTTWEGTLQMMAEKPWTGLGWNQVESTYDHYYRPAKLEEAAAIQLNDYLVMGAALGLPALLGFLAYVGLSLRQKPLDPMAIDLPQTARAEFSLRSDTGEFWQRTGCIAAVIVLLIGFWFEGGLFKLPTASAFWILLGLAAGNRARS